MITFIGLGPADAGGLSVAAREALRAAPLLFVRTARHPAVADLDASGVAYESLDRFYEAGESFDAVYDAIAAHVLEAAKRGDVGFAVPGHPLVAEELVRRLLARAREENVPVRIVGSASFLEPALSLLHLSLGDGLVLLDALALDSLAPRVDMGLLLYQVYDRDVASAASSP